MVDMVVNLELNDELFFETYVVPLVDEYDISRSGTEYPGYFKQLLPNRNISYITVQDIPNIKQCMLEIPRIIRPRVKGESRNGVGSYGGKHAIELYRHYTRGTVPYNGVNGYISNGEFMIAMLLCGYKPLHWIPDCINQTFDNVIYTCKELHGFDYDTFTQQFLSKFIYTEDNTKKIYLSNIDIEYPKELPIHYKDYFETALVLIAKKELKRHGKIKRNRQWIGVEWTGKYKL
jgi:hypothetical protein